MSGTALSWSDEATKAPVAGDRFAWSDEKDEPNVGSGPVTLNQRRGGSTVTGIPRLHGSDISQGIPGAAEKRMGQGFSPSQIVRNSLRGPALAAATVAPMLTGGASIPAEMLVSGLSGAAQSKLEGGSNMDAALAGGLGVAIPAALGNVPGLRNAMGRLTPPELYEPTNVWHGPDELPITNRLHGPETPAPITNVPHYPGAYPPEVIQARGLNLGGRTAPEPSAGLGKIPVRDILAERRLNPPAATETPRSEGDLFTRQFFSSQPTEDVGQAARQQVERRVGPLPRGEGPLVKRRGAGVRLPSATEETGIGEHGIPQAEWEAGHAIPSQVENTRIPRETMVPGNGGMRPLGANEDMSEILRQSVEGLQ